jgi:hypothetical protein
MACQYSQFLFGWEEAKFIDWRLTVKANTGAQVLPEKSKCEPYLDNNNVTRSKEETSTSKGIYPIRLPVLISLRAWEVPKTQLMISIRNIRMILARRNESGLDIWVKMPSISKLSK